MGERHNDANLPWFVRYAQHCWRSYRRYRTLPGYYLGANILAMMVVFIVISFFENSVRTMITVSLVSGALFSLLTPGRLMTSGHSVSLGHAIIQGITPVTTVTILSTILYFTSYLGRMLFPPELAVPVALSSALSVLLLSGLAALLAWPLRRSLSSMGDTTYSSRTRKIAGIVLVAYVFTYVGIPLIARVTAGTSSSPDLLAKEYLTPEEAIETYDPDSEYGSYSETQVDPKPKRRIPIDGPENKNSGDGLELDCGELHAQECQAIIDQCQEEACSADELQDRIDEATNAKEHTADDALRNLEERELSLDELIELYHNGTISGDELMYLIDKGIKNGNVSKWDLANPFKLKELYDAFAENNPEVAEAIGTLIRNPLKKDNYTNLLDVLDEEVGGIFTTVNDTVQVIEEAVEHPEILMEAIEQTASDWWQAAQEAPGQFWEGTKQVAGAVWHGAKSAWNATGNQLKKAWNYVKENPVEAIVGGVIAIGLTAAIVFGSPVVAAVAAVVVTVLTVVSVAATAYTLFSGYRDGGWEGMWNEVLSDEAMKQWKSGDWAGAIGSSAVDLGAFTLMNLPALPTGTAARTTAAIRSARSIRKVNVIGQVKKYLNTDTLKNIGNGVEQLADLRRSLPDMSELGKLGKTGGEALLAMTQEQVAKGVFTTQETAAYARMQANELLDIFINPPAYFNYALESAELGKNSVQYLNTVQENADKVMAFTQKSESARASFRKQGDDLLAMMRDRRGGGKQSTSGQNKPHTYTKKEIDDLIAKGSTGRRVGDTIEVVDRSGTVHKLEPRHYKLGIDPGNNGRSPTFKLDEALTAPKLEKKLNISLKRSDTVDVEWDGSDGLTYDAMNPNGQHFDHQFNLPEQKKGFKRQLKRHVYKADKVVVDVSNLSGTQKKKIEDYVELHYKLEHREKIIFID
ncbi:MAG: hypothetical protein ACOCXQ_00495 [Patescibacteria group bacterium]